MSDIDYAPHRPTEDELRDLFRSEDAQPVRDYADEIGKKVADSTGWKAWPSITPMQLETVYQCMTKAATQAARQGYAMGLGVRP